ncbi:MAG: hypothetical protein RX318_03910 [bacterium]|nr:hypothetical protein [bacterium]
MAISYPLSLPASPGVRAVALSARRVVAMTASPTTGQQQVQAHPGQWWSAQVALPPMVRADAEAWLSFLLKLDGRFGTFLLGDPAAPTPRGVATGTPLVNGASQAGNQLVTDGWTVSTTGILKAGDYIQLGTGTSTRLHKVLDDANSDGGGNATLTIWPNLRTSPADDDPITVSNAKGTFRLAQNEMPWEVDEALIYSVAFEAVEAI